MKQNFKPKACRGCGETFVPTNPCNTYCSSDCKKNNAYYQRNYGITAAEFRTMKAEQDHKCFLCGNDGFLMNPGVHTETLCVDHDHQTGKVRKLLCHNCNRALGLLGDNPELMRKCADYIEAYR